MRQSAIGGWGVASALVLSSAVLTACAPVELPPAVAPAQETPKLAGELAPLPPKHQWIVLDTPGDTAKVTSSRTIGTTAYGNDVSKDGPSCTTPCVVDAHVGTYTLYFSSTLDPSRVFDGVNVEVTGAPVVVRAVAGELHTAPSADTGVALAVVSVPVGLLGVALAGVGAAIEGDGDSQGGGGTAPVVVERIGFGLLGVGVVLAVTGLVMAYQGRGTHRSGATTTWTLPPLANPASPAVSGPPAFTF
jgi:hypothetical protein